MAKIQSKRQDPSDNLGKPNQKLAKQCYPSVLMDTSNPLMSQVAIFARCLEERESRFDEKLQLKI